MVEGEREFEEKWRNMNLNFFRSCCMALMAWTSQISQATSRKKEKKKKKKKIPAMAFPLIIPIFLMEN